MLSRKRRDCRYWRAAICAFAISDLAARLQAEEICAGAPKGEDEDTPGDAEEGQILTHVHHDSHKLHASVYVNRMFINVH